MTIGGDGPPLLLVHGWPQSWYQFRLLMPALARDFTVIAPDQRGMGDTDKPRGGYDPATLANDLAALMDALGHQRFAVLGCDTGMVISYALAADHPGRVVRLAVGEAPIPRISDFPDLFLTGPVAVSRVFHLLFNRLDALNEHLVRGREDAFFGFVLDAEAVNKLPAHAVRHYIDSFASSRDALRGSFGFYRAWDTMTAQNQERVKVKLTMPVLAIGGGLSTAGGPAMTMRAAATDVQELVIPGSGHFIAEEAPGAMLAALTSFLPRTAGPDLEMCNEHEHERPRFRRMGEAVDAPDDRSKEPGLLPDHVRAPSDQHHHRDHRRGTRRARRPDRAGPRSQGRRVRQREPGLLPRSLRRGERPRRTAALGLGPTGMPAWLDLLARLSRAQVVSIASIRGCARGAGSEFVLACDMRFASRENTLLGQFEVGIGVVPGGAPMARLSRLVGRGRALEILLVADDLDGPRAELYGYVNRAIADDRLDGEVDAIAARLARFDHEAIARTKAHVDQVTLPDDSELRPATADFRELFARPAQQAQWARLQELGLNADSELERSLGRRVVESLGDA